MCLLKTKTSPSRSGWLLATNQGHSEQAQKSPHEAGKELNQKTANPKLNLFGLVGSLL